MSNLEKLNKIISTQKSTWQEEARWREENEEWLSLSFDIAVRLLDTLKGKKITQKEGHTHHNNSRTDENDHNSSDSSSSDSGSSD